MIMDSEKQDVYALEARQNTANTNRELGNIEEEQQLQNNEILPTMRNLLSRESTETAPAITSKLHKGRSHLTMRPQQYTRTRSAMIQPSVATQQSEQVTHDSRTNLKKVKDESPQKATAKVNSSLASSFLTSLRRKSKPP